MQFFTDGLGGLIRVHSDAARGSREFFVADAEQLAVDGAWYPRRNLTLDILRSGDYWSTSESEAAAIIAETRRHHADEELAAFLLDLVKLSGDPNQPAPWRGFVRYDDSDVGGQPRTTGNVIKDESELVVSVTG